ncbi:hypothetical protein ACFXDE_02105 [Kitasatospora sp. NPDC059408]|uniref:hypothetical protein n=1 Tax=Kitasatospora sp. NPDC059408 TaxID=3346823 RepID=UPI003676D12D
MRLYSRTGATALDHPHHGRIEADPGHGGFDLPEELAEELRSFPAWETDVERQQRLVAEEIERRKDPATLLDAVQQLVQAAQAANAAKQETAGFDEDRGPAKPARARKAAASRPEAAEVE